MTELVVQREREDRLRLSLTEMRSALDRYQQQFGAYPAAIGVLTDTQEPRGGFYLRRLPLNPIVASMQWQIASKTSQSGTNDFWFPPTPFIISTSTTMPDGSPIVDIRCPDLGPGINGILYKNW